MQYLLSMKNVHRAPVGKHAVEFVESSLNIVGEQLN